MDNSNAHLLSNTSIIQHQSVEIYEDITLLDNHENKKLKSINENHYSDDPTNNNDYYYIKITSDDDLLQQDETIIEESNIGTPIVNKKLPLNNEISTSPPNKNNDCEDYYKIPNNTPIKET
jgi:hypothetical protein